MKTHVSLPLMILGGLAAFCLPAAAQVTLIDETFADGLRTGVSRATQWYSAQSSTSGTGNTVVDDASFSSGKAARFYGGSSNDALVASFTPVTLSAAGDYVEISAKVRYTNTTVATGTSSGPAIGLFNSGGTYLSGDAFGPDSYNTAVGNDVGYEATKYALGSTGDTKLLEWNPVGTSFFYSYQGTVRKTEDSEFTFTMGTLYTVTLRITLAENLTDLDFTYTVSDGGTSTHELSFAATAATTTFDEAVLLAYGGQQGKDADMGDILVTTNAAAIPEPSTCAALCAAAALVGAMVMRLRRGRC